MKDMAHIDPLDLADDMCTKLARTYAKYRFSERRYKDRRDAFIAALKMELKADIEGKVSVAELDMQAMAHPKFQKWNKAALKYLVEAGSAEIKYKEACRHWEHEREKIWMQSRESKRGVL